MQLHRSALEFTDRITEVAVIGPDTARAFEKFWSRSGLRFHGLPDPDHRISSLYGQQASIWRLGRMPAQVAVDRMGTSKFAYYGKSMMDIPSVQKTLQILDNINSSSVD